MKCKFSGGIAGWFLIFSQALHAQPLKDLVAKFESLNNLTYQMTLKQKDIFSDLIFSDTIQSSFDLSGKKEIFKIKGTKIEEIYDGSKLVKLDWSNRTYRIAKSIENSIFLYESLPYIINSIKQGINNDLSIELKEDSVIDGKEYSYLKMTELDTIKNGRQVYRTVNLLIDKENYLPVYCRKDHAGFIDGTDIFVYTYSEMNFGNYELDRTNFTDILSIKVPSEFVMEKPEVSKQLLKEGTQAPELYLNDASGRPFRLTNRKGNVILLNFSFNSCAHCVESITMLNGLYSKYGGNNFLIVTINPLDTKEAIQMHNNKFKVKYPIFINADEHTQNIDNYNVNNYPTFYLIDKAGNVIKGFEGYYKSLDEELDKLIQNHL